MKRFIMSVLDSDYRGIALGRVWGNMKCWRGGWNRLRIWLSADKYYLPESWLVHEMSVGT